MGSEQPPHGTFAPDDVRPSDDTASTDGPDGVRTSEGTGSTDPAAGDFPPPNASSSDEPVPAQPIPSHDAPLPGSSRPGEEAAGGDTSATGVVEESGFARGSGTSDEEAAVHFVRGEATPGSRELTVADGVLLAGGRIAVALRAGPAVVFVRADLPAELAQLRATVERALEAEGLGNLDRDSSLADGPARERIGITAARWDLWGHNLADVFAVLAAAAGGTAVPAAAVPEARSDGHAGAAGAPPLVEPAPAGTEAPSPLQDDGRSSWRSRPRLLVLGGLLVLALIGTAVAASSVRDAARETAGGGASPAEPSASPSSLAPLVDYRDPAGRFSLQYPQTWSPVETSDPDVALLLLSPDGGSMLVRLVPLETPIDPAKIEDVKAVTDVIVQSPTVQIVEQKPVDLSGVAGYYYLYTFQDAGTQEEGVHSHFFLFRDRSMHTLVFQALPTEKFENLAADFDRISQSYRIL